MTLPPAEPVYFLLVDDLEENLVALEALLRRDGLVLLKAKSGPDALEHLLKYDVALALVDVQMPGMDGFELAELMRGAERTRRTPIIFLTAGSDLQRRFRGYEAGAVDFLQKPIEPDILRGKAGVFFDLYRQRQEVARQRDELRAATTENARLLDESRRYAEALKEADRRKDEFLATLAHELRNPLAPIRNGLEILRTASDEGMNLQVRDMMDRQLAHMVRLIDDLLDVSRISSGKVVLKRERATLREMVESAVEASRPLIEAAGHAVRVSIPAETLALDADPTRVSQVVSNLLNNAAKYTPDGGRIELAVEPSTGPGPRTAAIHVKDTGVGIPPDMLPRVFDLFTQVGQTIDRAQGGLGIGLSLVKTLVEMHGGSVQAASAGLGQGSIFTVRLPLAPEPARREGTAQRSAQASASGRKILVVDDNVDGAESLAMMLKLTGHKTCVAHDGPSALTTAQAFDPDVVFLDIGMPGMNGYEVAQKLRQDHDRDQTVLVALTGWGTEEDKQKAHSAGFDHHLTKPVDLKRVTAMLAQIAQEKAARP